MPNRLIPIVVLGGSGYVAGELTRLLVQHPSFDLLSVVSTSSAGEPVAATFPHLAPALQGRTFESSESAKAHLKEKRTLGLFSALPHGEAAALIKEWIEAAAAVGCELKIVDLSADFRFGTSDAYQAVYGKPHPTPELLPQVTCALPDLPPAEVTDFVAHPGCFTTSVVLAVAPLLRAGIIDPEVVVSSVTGSTGAGRQPRPGTHHPERHGGLWAYEPLKHRHRPEMEMLIAQASGVQPQVAFVPHSGPYSRGIHSSIIADLKSGTTEAQVREAYAATYADSPFVQLRENWPSVKDVVGTNMCHLAIRVEGGKLFVASVIDNLTKGAAGGGVQWMNELFAFEKTDGLLLPGVGWS